VGAPTINKAMKLTKESKEYIDSLNYEQLLSRWRFAPIGDPWFQDQTGDYWGKRMSDVRGIIGSGAHVATSKKIGWDRS
jgi:hypothetical protein